MIQRKILTQIEERAFLKFYKMAIEFLHSLKVGDARVSESSLLNFFRESFEEISLIYSFRELNYLSFEIRLKSLK